ncbi:peptidyl-prolyl cis-trans isomerase CYP28, chloroplastic [Nymphaea colorata]|nr:peptidyl-prolyl cis-trans isomerase CYP28, chloroplastic [Nymphaea colorata]
MWIYLKRHLFIKSAPPLPLRFRIESARTSSCRAPEPNIRVFGTDRDNIGSKLKGDGGPQRGATFFSAPHRHAFSPPSLKLRTMASMAAILSSSTTSPPASSQLHPPAPPLPTRSHLPSLGRRPLLFLTATSSLSLRPPLLSRAEEAPSPSSQPPPSLFSPTGLDTTITDRIFMDFTACPTYFRPERTLDNEFSPCTDGELLGRVILGLYGKLVPLTVENFKALCTSTSSSSYKGVLVHKVFPGQYLMAGKQGRRDKGEVQPPLHLKRNTETVDPLSFRLKHVRPGTLSLCLSENDDDNNRKLDSDYRNVEFLITTGPGPCPDLDNRNIVFGTVLEGLDVVTRIAAIPTYRPAQRIRQFNELAQFLGDERAQIARNIWNRPLKAIYISDCGELKVAKPSLPPTLP